MFQLLDCPYAAAEAEYAAVTWRSRDKTFRIATTEPLPATEQSRAQDCFLGGNFAVEQEGVDPELTAQRPGRRTIVRKDTVCTACLVKCVTLLRHQIGMDTTAPRSPSSLRGRQAVGT